MKRNSVSRQSHQSCEIKFGDVRDTVFNVELYASTADRPTRNHTRTKRVSMETHNIRPHRNTLRVRTHHNRPTTATARQQKSMLALCHGVTLDMMTHRWVPVNALSTPVPRWVAHTRVQQVHKGVCAQRTPHTCEYAACGSAVVVTKLWGHVARCLCNGNVECSGRIE